MFGKEVKALVASQHAIWLISLNKRLEIGAIPSTA